MKLLVPITTGALVRVSVPTPLTTPLKVVAVLTDRLALLARLTVLLKVMGLPAKVTVLVEPAPRLMGLETVTGLGASTTPELRFTEPVPRPPGLVRFRMVLTEAPVTRPGPLGAAWAWTSAKLPPVSGPE